jgi:hypothetical protein
MSVAKIACGTTLAIGLLSVFGCNDPPAPEVTVQVQPVAPPTPESTPYDEPHRLAAIAGCIAFAKKQGISGLINTTPDTTFLRLRPDEIEHARGNPGDVNRPPPGWTPEKPQQQRPPDSIPTVPDDSSVTPTAALAPKKGLIDCWRVKFQLKHVDVDSGHGGSTVGTAHAFIITNDGQVVDSGEFTVNGSP